MNHPMPEDLRGARMRPRLIGPAVAGYDRPTVATAPTNFDRDQPLWDAASGRFNPVALRTAIVCRGWTVRDFAADADISRACLYNLLRHHAASDRTAVRVAATLASREPLHLLTQQ